MRTFVPPIKCQGIKTKLLSWVRENLQWDGQGTWVEPFCGSGVIGFNIAPKHAVFADINPHIIRFYQAIQTGEIDAAVARAFLEDEGEKLSRGGKEYYYEVRARFNAVGSPLDFLFLSRSCFNGVIRFNRKGGYNVPFCKKNERFTKPYVSKIVNQIEFVRERISVSDWRFVCQPFDVTLVGLSAGDFVYCDPPYIGRHVDYFDSWDERKELRLFELLSETPARFVLSTWQGNKYRKNVYVESHWSKFHILTREHFYHVGASEANRHPMIEALVLNYEPSANAAVAQPQADQLDLFQVAL